MNTYTHTNVNAWAFLTAIGNLQKIRLAKQLEQEQEATIAAYADYL